MMGDGTSMSRDRQVEREDRHSILIPSARDLADTFLLKCKSIREKLYDSFVDRRIRRLELVYITE